MKPNNLIVKASLQVSKPANTIFEAIVDPDKMSNYFIAQGSGRMEEGKTVTWSFPEFPDDFPVCVGKIIENSYISFYWEGAKGKELLVEIKLEPNDDATVVRITEGEMSNDEAGLAWLNSNSGGWANFLACMKAYLEYNINLRKGAFDYMAKK